MAIKGGRTDKTRFIQAGVIAVLIGIFYAVQQWAGTKQKKEGFQQDAPIHCVPGTELKLENGMCCPFGIVDVANCWLKPKCPEGSFWDTQRTACYSKDPNRSDPYVVGYPTCNTIGPSGKSFVFDLDQRKCCDPAVTEGPKVCDTNFICPRSTWDAKRAYCVGKTPGFTVALTAADTGPGVIPQEKTDYTLAWVFGGLTVVVLVATALRR